VRLFVAVWPPEDVVAALRAMDRPSADVRWCPEEQWHVTLRFLGSVDEGSVPALVDALSTVEVAAPKVTIGPKTKHLGPGVLMLPVRGLDDLAHEVMDATEDLVPDTEHRAFRGHLTVARAHHKGQIPRSLEGAGFDASWTASAFALVRSHTKPTGSVYENVATFPLST
jgi:2'-5' RNA ligase